MKVNTKHYSLFVLLIILLIYLTEEVRAEDLDVPANSALTGFGISAP